MLNVFIAPTKALCEPRRALSFCQTELLRLARISSPKRQAEYIAGHSLIRAAASQILGCDAHNEEWICPDNSAPQLTCHSHLTFSLSHSAGWVAALIETTQKPSKSNLKVGLDIELERDRKKLQQLARYSFTEEWLNKHQSNLLPAFFQRWTLCEALVKGSHKPLGTELLRHQRFLSDTASTSGHYLHHTRISKDTQTALSFEPHSALHMSLCSENYHESKDIRGFIHLNDKFVPLENIEFSVFKAPN